MGYLLGVTLRILLSDIVRRMLVLVLARRVEDRLGDFRNTFDLRYNYEHRREEEILPDTDDANLDHDIDRP